MDGYGALIAACLVGAGSFLTALAGFIVQIRRGDPAMKAELEQLRKDLDKEREKRRETERRQLITEAKLFDAQRRLVAGGLMTQDELEHGEREPDAEPEPAS